MKMIPVQSTAIRAIGYDGGTLGVRFHSGNTVYEHVGVPAWQYARFLLAPSKGTFYTDHIRGKYQRTKP